jgi:putative hydrolase of the HAD superfamily
MGAAASPASWPIRRGRQAGHPDRPAGHYHAHSQQTHACPIHARDDPTPPTSPSGILHHPVASTDQGYQGLLVDWGGVLTSNLFESFSAFCQQEGLAPDTIRRRFREDDACRTLLIDFETGKLEEEDFEPQFAQHLGVGPTGLIDRLFAGSSPDEEMLDAVRQVRAAGVRTGLISNSWGTRRYPKELLSELFDGVVISGQVGIRKPAPEIYAMGAEQVGLPPTACVFVDDLPFNLPPARELGMATVHHTSSADTIPQLERLFDLQLT